MSACTGANKMMAEVNRLYQKATRLHQQGRLADAEKLYKKILAQAPDYAPVFNVLGILAAQQGALPEAIDFFARAVKAVPDDLAPRENLARAWQTMGQFDKAQTAYADALKIKPDSYVALFGLGRALQSQKKYTQALSVFERAQIINTADAALYLNMGHVSQQLEHLEDAALYYKKALALEPDSIDANACLGHLSLQLHDYSFAERYFSHAIAMGARRSDIEFGLAQALEHSGQEAAAKMHYFKAVELDPGSQNAYIQLDQFLLKSGGEKKKAFLNELAADYIYTDWQESVSDLRKLASMLDYPDLVAVRALHAFIEEYRPGELHEKSWWQDHLDSFGGVNNSHDKLLRSLHSAVYCWSLPDKETMTEVAGFVADARLCSYGAGSGVWECLLQQHFGVDVIASDYHLRHRFLPMQQVDYSKARVVPTDCIFFAWILRGDLGVLNIFMQMQQGQKLVLIGEPPDREGIPRICATPQMWSLLNREFSLVKTLPLVSYSLLNDTVSLYVKN